jgi:hypothetical protein
VTDPKRTAGEAFASAPRRRMARTADPPPAAGNTSPPSDATPAPLAEGTQTPAGGASSVPAAGLSAPPAGQAGRDAWKAAQSARNAAQRRGRFTRAAKKTGPGMLRKMPPTTTGEA